MKRFLISVLIISYSILLPRQLNAQSTLATLTDPISWEIPEDGGTPRDSSRFVKTSENKYHIQASFEDGGESVLKHAVSRMDLVCKNSSTKNISIILEIDLSQDGKRTDYDNKPESGMKLRDFIFIKSPGNQWKQVNGHTNGWTSIVELEIAPGKTFIGLSPWYTYADYLAFIGSLVESPSLRKKMIAKSDGKREQWELTITDTSISETKKEKIFWQAREHAYETFSSWAMEGLIPFLLSDKAKGFRERYIIIIHPMTNVDGVARGYEYRAGYDFPETRVTMTGRLTFDAVDRLHPDYAVAWHNWVAPRDRNVVFYTDGDHGTPTPRAWLRFTQLFPSLRQWDHRWKDEDIPLKYNWQNKVVGDNNIHQYAMKHYGTRIWGWEMPWWNFSADDAKAAGAAFGFAFLTTLDELKTGSVAAPQIIKEAITVTRFSMYQFSVNAKANVTNPWQDAMLVGEFISPSGKKLVLDGFYDGNNKWMLRFTPDETGIWTYQLRGEGIDALQQGRIVCTASTAHGHIGIHPANPYAFAYEDSSPF